MATVSEVLYFVSNRRKTAAKDVLINSLTTGFTKDQLVAAKALLAEVYEGITDAITKTNVFEMSKGLTKPDSSKQQAKGHATSIVDAFAAFESYNVAVPTYASIDYSAQPRLATDPTDIARVMAEIESLKSANEQLYDVVKKLQMAVESATRTMCDGGFPPLRGRVVPPASNFFLPSFAKPVHAPSSAPLPHPDRFERRYETTKNERRRWEQANTGMITLSSPQAFRRQPPSANHSSTQPSQPVSTRPLPDGVKVIKGSQTSSTLRAAPPKAPRDKPKPKDNGRILYARGLAADTTKEELFEFLKAKDINVLYVGRVGLNAPRAKFVASFCIRVATEDRDKVLNDLIWPAGCYVRDWIDKPRDV